MLCQEESRTFQIVFIPGIFCHLLDQELLSYPLLCSPIKTEPQENKQEEIDSLQIPDPNF